MNDIKRLKAQALLQEVIQEALGELNDARINNLSITRVECSRGKESAKVFINPIALDESQKIEILRALKKANSAIRAFAQNSLSWYKMPVLSYFFDESLNDLNKLDAIFKEIHEKRKS